MNEEPIIAESARKWGVEDDDMLHAVKMHKFVHGLDEGFTMVVGAARDGALIEVGFIISDDGTMVIVHAMNPARDKYLRGW